VEYSDFKLSYLLRLLFKKYMPVKSRFLFIYFNVCHPWHSYGCCAIILISKRKL